MLLIIYSVLNLEKNHEKISLLNTALCRSVDTPNQSVYNRIADESLICFLSCGYK